MNNCKEFFEHISAYADGELQGEEKSRLEEHLAQCPRCASLLEAFYEMSAAVGESEVPVPEGFSGKIMSKIVSPAAVTEEKTRQGQESAAKKTISINRLLTRYIPAAACIAVILLAAPRLSNLGCSSSSEQAPGVLSGGGETIMSYSMDSGGGGDGGAAVEPRAESAIPPAGGQVEERIENGVITEPQAPGEMPVPSPAQTGTGGLTETPEENEDTYFEISPSVTHKSGVYYAVVYVTGELPESLKIYEPEDAGGGTVNYYIPRELATELERMGYPMEILNEDAADAMVVYTAQS